jgi:hypothetical protein
MFPHERSLVKRLEGKPFALLGVNSDQDRQQVIANNQKEQITWRSWFDGGTQGPICQQYKIKGFPTIYVLDQHGVIRYKNVREGAMDQAVDTLLREMGQ